MPDASVSAHVDEGFLNEFDETFDCGKGGSVSRSKAIAHAMRWAVRMEKARKAVGWVHYANWRDVRAATGTVFELADRQVRSEGDG